MAEDDKLTLTVSQAAKLIGFSPRKLYRLIAAGRFIRPSDLPGKMRFSRRNVEQFIEVANGNVRKFNQLKRNRQSA
ncbi:helix-turn-helix domain-containing protein [Symmachiella dynata]|uniref:helix-turn-helix domain-containing protein n=1 Tax=Symmachiella dynata TaxID=2527995 RepID=UPI003C6EE18D